MQEQHLNSSSHRACIRTNTTRGQGWHVWLSWVWPRTRASPQAKILQKIKKKKSSCTEMLLSQHSMTSLLSAVGITHSLYTWEQYKLCSVSSEEALMAFVQSLLLTIPWQHDVALASAGLLLAVGRKDLKRQHPWEQHKASAILSIRV